MKFNGVYSRNNLPKIKARGYLINFDEYKSIGTHWIALYVNDNNVTYFDIFGVEHILREIRKLIGNKNILANIYRIQAYDSIMCTYFCCVNCSKRKSEDEKVFKEEKSIEILKILVLIYNAEGYQNKYNHA